MANHKRKATHRKHKGCGLCNQDKRMGNNSERTPYKYRRVDIVNVTR